MIPHSLDYHVVKHGIRYSDDYTLVRYQFYWARRDHTYGAEIVLDAADAEAILIAWLLNELSDLPLVIESPSGVDGGIWTVYINVHEYNDPDLLGALWAAYTDKLEGKL